MTGTRITRRVRRRGRRRTARALVTLTAIGLVALVFRMASPAPQTLAGLPVPPATEPSSVLWGPLPPRVAATTPPPGTGTRPPAVPAFSGRLRTVAAWADIFAGQWQEERSTAQALSRSGDSWDQYDLAYDLDALTAAYLATGRDGYVDEGLGLLENLVSTATVSRSLPGSQYRDDYQGWTTRQPDERGQEVPLYESYLWRYGIWLLRVVHDDPRLIADPTRRSRFERLRAFAEHDIFDKWWSRGADDTVYRSRTHMAAHWALIALGLSRITTDDGRRRRYLDTLHAIDDHLPNAPSSLRRQLRMNPRYPSAYLWNDRWGATDRPGQDVSHGNAVIAYVVDANELRIDWTNLDMARFTDTLRLVVWPARPRPGQPEGAEYVDGTGTGQGWFSDGFVKLGRFDPQLQLRLQDHDVGRSPQYLANGALNAALLACRGIDPRAAPATTPACRLP